MHNLSTDLSNLQTKITPRLMQQWINKPETKYVHWVESKSLDSLSRLIRLAATVQWLNKYWKNSFRESALSEFTAEHFVGFISCLATQYHQSLRASAPGSHHLNLEFLAGLNDFLRKYVPESSFRKYEDESADSKSGRSPFYQLVTRIMRRGNFKAQPLMDIFRVLYNRELFSNIDLGKSFSVLATLAQKKFLEGKIDNLIWLGYEAKATGPRSVAKLLTNYSTFAEGGHLQQVFKVEMINELLSSFKEVSRGYLSINQISSVIYSLNNLVKHSALANIVNLDVDSLSVLLTSLKKSPAKMTQLDKLSAFLLQLMNMVNSSSLHPRMLTMASLLTLVNLADNIADAEDYASGIAMLLNTGKIIKSEDYKQNELEALRSKILPLFENILQNVPQLICKEIANTLYSAVLLGVQLPEQEVERLVKRFQKLQGQLNARARAVLAHKMAQYLYFNQLPISPLFLKWSCKRKPEPTELQKKVFAALKSLLPVDYKVEMEALVGIWPVDILITYGGRKYVFEIDGSTHTWHGRLRIKDRMRDNAFKIRENVVFVKRAPVSHLRLKFTAILEQTSANIIKKFKEKEPVSVEIKPRSKTLVTRSLPMEDNSISTVPEIGEVEEVKVREKPAKKTEALPTANKKLSPLKNLSNRLSQNADLKEIGVLAKKIIPASITGDEATQLLAKGLIYDMQAHKKSSSPTASVFSLILELTETHSYLKPISKTQGCALEKLIIDNNAAALEAVISLITPMQKKSRKGQKTTAVNKLSLPSSWRAAVEKALEFNRDNLIEILNRSFSNVFIAPIPRQPLKELKYSPENFAATDTLIPFTFDKFPKRPSLRNGNQQMPDFSGLTFIPESFAEAEAEFPRWELSRQENHSIESDLSERFSFESLVEFPQTEVGELKVSSETFTFGESTTTAEEATSVFLDSCQQPCLTKTPLVRQIKTAGGSPIIGQSGDHHPGTDAFSMLLS
jgi:hypothetical protein